jgi:hypothetical protein
MQNYSGLNEETILLLMEIVSKIDGVKYESFTRLNFSRSAICLYATGDVQKTISVETAKQLLKENA